MNSRYPELAPAQAWQLAYQWLCQRRRHYPANADIWHLRFHWPARSATLFARVMAGHYRLSPMQLLGGHAIWSAEDALVLKWVALRVAPRLPWHPACEHGRGMGVVASRRRLHDFLQGAGGSHPYVLRTDIRGYYQHIDRARVLSRLVAPLPCPVCRELIRQYLYYSVECGGEFHTPSGGISRGCALSPLIGASLLWHIDADFAARGELYYARYMDDFIVLARTRWRLRDAVRRLNGYLAADGFSQPPAKTWIGRLDRGIDWLGGWYTTQGRVGIAPNALQRYRTKSLRLYEQTLRAGNPETECQRRVRGYFKRWRGSVVTGYPSSPPGPRRHTRYAPTQHPASQP
ncbi:TPA: transposase [Aeromonas dhakensis]|nr:transposase [Aeromonas dhakensis]